MLTFSRPTMVSYEIAYRIELYWRSLETTDKYIVRTANVFWKPKETDNAVVGFLEDAAEAPQATSKAILTGEAGIGKTTLLSQIEHKWSLPKVAEKGKIACWLPIPISLAGKGDKLDENLRQNWHSSFPMPYTNTDVQMPCHAMIKDWVSSDSLKWLFSSPILLLVDGLDEVNPALSADFSLELTNMLGKNIFKGVIVAKRENRASPTPDVPAPLKEFPFIELRELSNKQINEFMQKDNYSNNSLNVVKLLGFHDKPISRYLRNPFLLDIACLVSSNVEDLSNMSLGGLLNEYICIKERQGLPKAITCRILPKFALGMIKDAKMRVDAKDEDNYWQVQARHKDILTFDDYSKGKQVRFRHEYLLDFFAAKGLQDKSEQNGLHDSLNDNELSIKRTLGDWVKTIQILLGLLKSKADKGKTIADTETLVRFLEGSNPIKLCHFNPPAFTFIPGKTEGFQRVFKRSPHYCGAHILKTR